MLFQKTLAFLVLTCVLFSAQSFAQQKTLPPPAPKEISAALKHNAVALLRETINEIPKLKTEQNRQYFTVETAALLWRYDEAAARTMFEGEMTNLRKLVSQFVSDVVPKYSKSVIGENYHRLEMDSFLRWQNISALRNQLIKNLALVEPETAYNFLVETERMLPESEGDLQFRDMFNRLEETIILSFIGGNEIDKAVKVARGMSDKEFSDELVNQIKIIYESDPQKGSAFAEEVLQKIKVAKLKTNQNYIIRQFLESAIDSRKAGKQIPLLSADSIRDLAKFLGQSVLAVKVIDYTLDKPFEYADLIESYAPQEAEQIRQKFKKNLSVNANSAVYEKELNESVKNQMEFTKENFKAEQAGIKKREEEKKEIFQKLESRSFSSAEKTQLVERIKKLISEMTEIKRRSEKVKAMTSFAVKSRDREITEKIMNEAVAVTNPQAKSSEDYMSNWWLASGYSSFDANKSFAILENITPGFNEVIASFSKIAEFVDDGSSIFANGEITMAGGFGDGIGADFFKGLTDSPAVIRNLAESDFTRTKNLADKFNRLEFRLTARLLILNSLLRAPQIANE